MHLEVLCLLSKGEGGIVIRARVKLNTVRVRFQVKIDGRGLDECVG
jgi:hypothetical protein